jgi:hypothetical protein
MMFGSRDEGVALDSSDGPGKLDIHGIGGTSVRRRLSHRCYIQKAFRCWTRSREKKSENGEDTIAPTELDAKYSNSDVLPLAKGKKLKDT